MKQIILLITLIFIAKASFAGNLVKVKAIGKSPKGQFIAFEEFGFTHSDQKPFSKIRVMNMWKNKYVTKEVKVTGLEDETSLDQVRAKAKKLARKDLISFNISG